MNLYCRLCRNSQLDYIRPARRADGSMDWRWVWTWCLRCKGYVSGAGDDSA